jgi:UrcA family protein
MLIGFAGTLGVALSAQAGAPSTPTYESVVVRYADLNLETTDGARTLYARISAAAERACGSEPSHQELKMRSIYRACYEDAMNKAVMEVGSRQLHALHASGKRSRNVG